MRTGRPRKDNALNELHGNPGKRKSKKRRVILAKDVKFGIPRGLPESVRIKAREAAQYLADNKISKKCDRAAFERYCQHLHVAYLAYGELKKAQGIVHEGHKGVITKHPAFQQHRDSSFACLKYEEQFGLTPLSRGKVKVGSKDKKKDPLAEFQARGKKLEAVK